MKNMRVGRKEYLIAISTSTICCDDCVLGDLNCANMLDKVMGKDRLPCNNSSEGVQYTFIEVPKTPIKIKSMAELHGSISECGNFFIDSKTYPLTVRFNNSLGIKRVVLTISKEEKSNTLSDLESFGFEKYEWAETELLIATKKKLECYDKDTQYDIQTHGTREYIRIWVEKGFFDTIVLSKNEYVKKKEGKIENLLG
ncbi:MAG: hypothetical protein ACRC92_21805 [Peptostreptococcaceae bacterium]